MEIMGESYYVILRVCDGEEECGHGKWIEKSRSGERIRFSYLMLRVSHYKLIESGALFYLLLYAEHLAMFSI